VHMTNKFCGTKLSRETRRVQRILALSPYYTPMPTVSVLIVLKLHLSFRGNTYRRLEGLFSFISIPIHFMYL
jgi:hypothetical protein